MNVTDALGILRARYFTNDDYCYELKKNKDEIKNYYRSDDKSFNKTNGSFIDLIHKKNQGYSDILGVPDKLRLHNLKEFYLKKHFPKNFIFHVQSEKKHEKVVEEVSNALGMKRKEWYVRPTFVPYINFMIENYDDKDINVSINDIKTENFNDMKSINVSHKDRNINDNGKGVVENSSENKTLIDKNYIKLNDLYF